MESAAIIDRGWSSIVCVATGPSLTAAQAELVRYSRARVIAINDAYRLLPDADVLYACDGSWWKVNITGVRSSVSSELWTQDEKAADQFGIKRIPSANKPGLCKSPNLIHQGANSGFQAMNLAYHFGAKRIVLVGYDCQRTNNKAHYFGDHPHPLSRTHSYRTWAEHFHGIAVDLADAGVEVVNCSTQTALEHFRRGDLAAELDSL